MNLLKAIDLFLGEHKPTTAKSYLQPLKSLRDWVGPARELSDISPELLIEYFQMLNKRGYALATVQKHVITVKTFFNWIVKIDKLEKSPARVIRGRKLPRAISRDKAMSDAELSAIIDAVRYKPRDYALVMFLSDSGCRRGGAAGLRLQDINWRERTAKVTEKGDKPRFVAFGEHCQVALVKWLGYRGSLKGSLPGVYIFSFDGALMKPENISLIIRRAAAKAGVRVLSSHSLRHRKGHQYADARIAPSIAATALGHSDVLITLNSYYPGDWESAKKTLHELATDPSTLKDSPDNIVKFGS